MRILHCCLALPYIPDGGYQEARLPEINRADGCEVFVAASPAVIKGGKYTTAPIGCFETESGIKVERLAYHKLTPGYIGSKLRIYPRFAALLEEVKPDIIYHHGPQTPALLVSAKYKKKHPGTALLVDSHANYVNSAKGFVSHYLLHRCYYRAIYNLAYKHIDQICCIGYEEYRFAREMLRDDTSKMKLMPLGDTIISQEERMRNREQIRGELGLSDDTIVMLHSGRLSEAKRTIALLNAMEKNSSPRLRLFIIGGGLAPSVEEAVNKAVASDDRIRFFSWKTAPELRRYMCAADIYLQPGTVSSSLPTAMCTGLGVMCQRLENYVPLFGDDNGAVFADSDEEIAEAVGRIADGQIDVVELQRKAYEFAKRRFDYYAQSAEFIYPWAEGK